MGPASPRGVVLDAGALIAFERGDGRMRSLVAQARRRRRTLTVPAAVLAQVWRDGARQARLAALVGDPVVEVQALDERIARASGVLCGRAGTRDVVDASVVIAAHLVGGPVVTGDPDDLLTLDPHLEVERI